VSGYLKNFRNSLALIAFSMNLFVLRRIYHMNISSSARIALGAYLDKTNPKDVYVGDESFVSTGAMILTHDYCRSLHKKTYIGKNCFIGVRSIILPGITLGDHVIVGAGSVVTHDIQSHCIVAGNPARIIKENINTTKYGQLKIEV
jgi:acetyltransferase-like isoleucine patch superfamily enzyme